MIWRCQLTVPGGERVPGHLCMVRVWIDRNSYGVDALPMIPKGYETFWVDWSWVEHWGLDYLPFIRFQSVKFVSEIFLVYSEESLVRVLPETREKNWVYMGCFRGFESNAEMGSWSFFGDHRWWSAGGHLGVVLCRERSCECSEKSYPVEPWTLTNHCNLSRILSEAYQAGLHGYSLSEWLSIRNLLKLKSLVACGGCGVGVVASGLLGVGELGRMLPFVQLDEHWRLEDRAMMELSRVKYQLANFSHFYAPSLLSAALSGGVELLMNSEWDHFLTFLGRGGGLRSALSELGVWDDV